MRKEHAGNYPAADAAVFPLSRPVRSGADREQENDTQASGPWLLLATRENQMAKLQ